MIVGLGVLLPLLALAIWAFARFRPRTGSAGAVRVYNGAVILIALSACGFPILYFYRTTGQSIDYPWWPVLAALGSLLAFSIVLLVGALVRNLVLFR